MSQSLSRLKGLAQGLNSELNDQDKLLDRLQISTDKADWRIQRQNKDMERLLKKWGLCSVQLSCLRSEIP